MGRRSSCRGRELRGVGGRARGLGRHGCGGRGRERETPCSRLVGRRSSCRGRRLRGVGGGGVRSPELTLLELLPESGQLLLPFLPRTFSLACQCLCTTAENGERRTEVSLPQSPRWRRGALLLLSSVFINFLLADRHRRLGYDIRLQACRTIT